MPEIGAALREARMRARIDISEIEAQTKIRAKYLRALENEEWDLLPGPTFVKSFLRTYAQALGLDDKALVEEYRASYERPNEAELQPIVSTARRPPGQRGARTGPRGVSAPSRAYTIAIAVVSLLIVVLVIALLSGGGSSDNTPTTTARVTTPTRHHTPRTTHTPAGTSPAVHSEVVALSVQPTGPVYVCLLGEGERKLIPGLILSPNPTHSTVQPTYHAKHFLLTLGNNAVRLLIDGSIRTVPSSSQSIGYSITKAGGRHSLPPSQQPTCK
jgi:cytoskeleton protein RodZ